MPGSADSISCTNTILNTIVADVFDEFSARLESANDFEAEAYALIKETYAKHKRIIFGGDGYSEDWENEAAKRGLLNLKDTVSAFSHYCDKQNVELFLRHKIYSETELRSRTAVLIENYSKVVMIEGKTALSMLNGQILPAFSEYATALIKSASIKTAAGLKNSYEKETANELCNLSEAIYNEKAVLNSAIEKALKEKDNFAQAAVCRDEVLSSLRTLRSFVDKGEALLSKEYLPYPSYDELLFSI
jgi:glutamine synthetase